MWVTASFSSFSRRPVITTWAPSSTKRLAVARPIPLLPPVITATLPSSAPIDFSFDHPLFTLFRTNHYRCGRRCIGFTILDSNLKNGEQSYENRERKDGTTDQL